MNIYTIIVTYNAMQWIDKCVHSLVDSTTPTTIVVVDNASSDNTLKHITDNYPNIVLLSQTKNIGFGQANNIGITYALKHGATHLFLLNQDADIMPDTLEQLLIHDNQQHLLSPIHLNSNGSQLDCLFKSATILTSAKHNRIIDDIFTTSHIAGHYNVDYVNAACWLIPKQIIERVGGFNPLFFQYGEDNNFIHRLHYYGIGLQIVTNSFIHHHREQHGSENVYQKDSIYRSLLLIKTNINLSIGERHKLMWKEIIQSTGASIFQHQFLRHLIDLCRAISRIIMQAKTIKMSRITEQTQPAWIQI